MLTDERLTILRAARINIPLQTLDRISADSLFMANFEEYKAFREIHGRAPYIHENLVLFHWCSEVRIGYKKREQGLEVIASNGVEITVGREALLRSVGFDFILPVSTNRKPTGASADRSFSDRIKSLKRYKEKHGHLNHRLNGDGESKSLVKFVNEVRSSYHRRLDQIKNNSNLQMIDTMLSMLLAILSGSCIQSRL